MLKLITDEHITLNDIEYITEQTNSNAPKFIKIKGPYIVAERRNANKRLYKRNLMENSIKEYVDHKINSGRGYGELNHPPSSEVNMDRACHIIQSLTPYETDKNIWIGESVILSSSNGRIGTPCGDIVASIIQHGGKVGVSTRGVGEINEDNIVEKDYKLICVDVVTEPSIGDFCDGILESKNFMINTHGEVVEYAYEKLNKQLKTIPSGTTLSIEGKQHMYRILKEFINSI